MRFNKCFINFNIIHTENNSIFIALGVHKEFGNSVILQKLRDKVAF